MAEVEERTTVRKETEQEQAQIRNESETETETEVSKRRQEMKPWEQHGGVISIPRFDYNAPSSLLQHSHSGFLITCTLKREKSATKEAMSILGKFVGSFTSCTVEGSDKAGENSTSKRRKTCTEDLGDERINGDESNDATDNSEDKSGNPSEDISLSSAKINTVEDRNSLLSLVKLTRSGLLLFTFTRGTSFDTVQIVSNIIQSLESAGSGSPQWCHRIFPIQATCTLNDKELRTVVSELVLKFVNDKQNKLARPLKFAVGYNRRGIEETEMKIKKDTSTASNLLDRNSCFSTVAAAVKDVVPESVVNLKTPDLSVLVELLPLSGLPNGSLVVAVSVLPQNLVSTKPRLCIKALVSNLKSKSGKH